MSLTLLKDKILPAVFNKDGCKFVSCEFDLESVGEDQFMSTVVFLTAVVQLGEKKTDVPLVVKFEPANEEARKFLGTNTQFHNEVFMYGTFLPFLNRHNIVEDIFAQFYYGVGTDNSDDTVVVLEDLKPKGYRLADEKGFIDYEHLVLALEKLGRFHALSFAAKKRSPGEFFNLVKSLKEPSWTENNPFDHVIEGCVHRAVDPLIRQGKHVEVLQRFLDRIDNSVQKFMLDLVGPDEPSAVVCHGDFCRNNVLFKYADGKPTDVKFFDIATSRYSSPAVDLMFFLFLNCSPEVRRAHWDDLLTIYHHALSTAVPGIEVPSLEDIQTEAIRKAVYGFIHCSFFLLIMLYDDNPFPGTDTIVSVPIEQVVKDHIAVGGEEGTKLLSDMVLELVDIGCLTLDNKLFQLR